MYIINKPGRSGVKAYHKSIRAYVIHTLWKSTAAHSQQLCLFALSNAATDVVNVERVYSSC